MFKRKLLKRALPIILSVAMVFETMPATALAAEYEEPETVVESTVDEEPVEDAQAEAEASEASEVNESEADTTEPAKTQETTTDTQEAEEITAADGDDSASEAANNEGVDLAAEDESETASQTPTQMPEKDEATKLVINYDGIRSKINGTYNQALKYDAETKTIIAAYDKEKSNPFGDSDKGLVYDIKTSYISVLVDNKDKTNILKTHVTYQWEQKNADGSYAKMDGGKLPVNAGDYRLVVSLGAVEGACEAAKSQNINFRIDQKEIEIDYQGRDTVVPGTKVSEVKADIRENYELTGLNKEAYVASEDVVIMNASDKTVVADDRPLLKTGDYILEMKIVFNADYAGNYKVTNSIVNITMSDAVATAIRVTNKKTDGSAIGKVFDDKAIDVKTDVEPYFEAVVGVEDTNEKGGIKLDKDGKEIILNVVPTYTWRDANGEEIDAEDVINAGTYQYVLTYEGEEGIYQPAEETITVIITPANIVIDPQVKDGAAYPAGITAAEALKTVTGAKVYPVTDGVPDESSPLDISKDKYFWGVSYNEEGVTQSYEPTFVIQKGITEKVESADSETAKTVTTWTDIAIKDYDKPLVKEEGISYRIIFSGKKAVYDGEGRKKDDDVDINASQENYRVDCSNDMLEKYAKAVEVTVSNAEINVDEMLKDGAGKDFDHPIISVYTGEQLFKTRDLYKKAVVKTGSGDVKYTDSRITYTWERRNGYRKVDVLDENGNPVKDEDGNIQRELVPNWQPYTYHGYNPNVEVTSTPSEAGDYRIVISYEDKENAVYASNAEVYYTIQKQNVQIQLPEGVLPAYIGSDIEGFLTTVKLSSLLGVIPHFVVKGTVVEENGAFKFVQDAENAVLDWTEYIDHELDWYVERLIKDGPKAGTYEELRTGTFLEGQTYRLAVRFGEDNEEYDYYEDYSYPGKNYNNRYQLDKHNGYVYDSDDEFETNPKIAYENGTCAIALSESQGIELNVDIDWSKVTNKAKIYDGTPLSNEEIIDAMTITNAKDGSIVKIEDVDPYFDWYYAYGSEKPVYVLENAAIHVGTYYFCVTIAQNETYKGGTWTFGLDNADDTIGPKVFEIVPRELTVTPSLKDEIKAGTYISNSASNADAICAADPVITGYIAAADAAYFEHKTYDANMIPRPYAFSNLTLSVYEKTGTSKFSGYLRGNTSYNVSYSGSLRTADSKYDGAYYLSRDYKPVYETVAITPVRGTSSVASTAYITAGGENAERTRLNDDISKDESNIYTHTIKPREGIAYTKNAVHDDEKDENLSGNWFVFQITRPTEYTNEPDFRKNVVYENSIKDADGYILQGLGASGNAIVVAFDAAAFDADAATKTKEFEIIWEDGYSEKFVVDFTNCILNDNLEKAVLPKSIAFNGASTKMTVGETQQLDLKITKNQLSDIICIKYELDESSDPEILNVSETGYVTALSTKGAKSASATVCAYAAYKDADGEIKVYTDAKTGKPAKAAQVKITVSPVTAVKGIKVEAHDTYAYVDYTLPTAANCTRREVYVLEGKKTVIDFEDAIKAVSSGNYDAFACKPIFTASTSKDVTNNKGIHFYHRLTGLTPNTPEYTVYVRNVSVLRTTADGRTVEESYAGTVSTFKTTKAQERELHAYFDTKDGGTVDGDCLVKIEEDKETGKIPLNVQLNVEAKYLEGYGKEYSDEEDYIWRKLPLSKKDDPTTYDTYVDPKLTYYVTDAVYYAKPNGIANIVNVGNMWFEPSSKIAAIDKKGMISLKGVGTIAVIVYNEETGHYDKVSVTIISSPDTVTGKSGKLSVGNSVYLTDYLTYKFKNVTLNGYGDWYFDANGNLYNAYTDLSIDKESNEYFEITPVYATGHYGTNRDDQFSAIIDYRITAKNPGGDLTLTVTDNTVKANSGAPATVNIKSAEIEAVKGLKAKDVVDTYGYITFTYSANNDFKRTADGSKLAFRIEVTDAFGKILSNELVNAYMTDDQYNADTRGFESITYDAKKKVETYTYRIGGLTRLSNYTVSVTPLYGENEPKKPASTKIKTTNTPASYEDILAGDGDGGTEISIKTRNGDGDIDLSEYPLLVSGNTYTLELPLTGTRHLIVNHNLDNPYARLMKTDSLTWKSSNPKVAAVKAKAGSFTAELKAAGKGETTISVTSKITKKVIAKWTVIVNAVGEAGGYYGDYYEKYDEYDWDNLVETLGIDVLTLNNPLKVTLAKGEQKLVAFTAPAYGKYTITSTSKNNNTFLVYDSSLKRVAGVNRTTEFDSFMQKGKTYCFSVSGEGSTIITATGTEYTTVVPGNSNKVKGGSYIHFEAPEDNYYTFTYKQNGAVVNGLTRSYSLNKGATRNLQVPGDSKDEYVLEITSRKPDSIAKNTDKTVDIEKDGENWYSFTADATGWYTIYTTNAKALVEGERFASLKAENGTAINNYDTVPDAAATENAASGDSNNVRVRNLRINKGDTVYIRLSSEEENKGIVLRVDSQTVPESTVVLEKENEAQYLTYAVPSDGSYRFEAVYTEPTDGTLNVTWTTYVGRINSDEKKPVANIVERVLNEGDLVIFKISADKAKTAVSIKVTPTEPEKLQPGEEKSKEISKGISETFTFTAPADGWYSFDFTVDKKENETAPGVHVVIADNVKRANDPFDVYDEPQTREKYLTAGQVMSITISSANAEKPVEVKIKAAKQEVSELGGTISFKAKETKRFYWTAPGEGLYSFTATVTPEDGTVTINQCDTTPDGTKKINSIEALSGYMKNGETYYLTLTAGDKDVSYKVDIAGITPLTLTAGQELPIELEADAEKWVEFTAKKTALYEYAKADADGFNIEKRNGLDDKKSGAPAFNTRYGVIYAGEKQFFKVTNKNAEKKTVKLKISETDIPEVTLDAAGKTVTVGDGITEQVFRFTAAEAARYQFDVKATKKNEAGESVSATAYISKYTENLLSEQTSDGSVVVLNAGKTVYLYVGTESGAVDVTLKAAKIAAAKTLEVNAEQSLTFTENETMYLEFSVPEDGIYTFTAVKADAAEGESTTPSGLAVTYYKNLENDAVKLPLGSSKEWKKGDKLVLVLTSKAAETIKVKITKEELNELKVGESQQITIKDGEVRYFKLNSSEACRYFIETHGVAQNVTLEASFVGGTRYYTIGKTKGNGFYYSYVGNKGENEVIFKITSTGAEADTSFQIGAGTVAPETITAGDAKDIKVSEIAPNHMVWYSFTPAEAGRYVIKTNDDANTNAKLLVFDEYYPVDGSQGREYELPRDIIITKDEAGKEYVFAVSYAGSSSTDAEAQPKDFQFSVYKAAAAELTETSPVNVDITKVVAGEKVWISFKAPADNKYLFTNDSSEYLYTEFYKSVDKDTSADAKFSWNREVYMEEGEEILFAAYYYNAPEKAFSIKVSGINPEALTVSAEADPAKTIELTGSNSVKWLKLTATSAARYQFTMTDESETNKHATAFMYWKLSDDNRNYVYNGDVFGAEANQTVYFKLTGESLGETDKVTVSIKVTKEADMEALKLGESKLADIEPNGGEKWAYFTADETGFYQFKMSGNCRVYQYNTINDSYYEDSYEDEGTFTYGLEKGTSLYFKAVNNTAQAETETITVTKTDTVVKELSVGDSDTAKPDENNRAWYIFTVPEDGKYKISARNAHVWVVDSLNIGAYGSWNDWEQHEKGEVFYLLIEKYDWAAATDDVTVTCTRVNEREFSGEGTINVTLGKGEALYVNWTADKGTYDLGFTARYAVNYEYSGTDSWTEGSSSSETWQTVMHYDDEGATLYIESANEGNIITISAVRTLRKLPVNSVAYAAISKEEGETFYVTPSEGGEYIFASGEAENMYALLYDSEGKLLKSDKGSGEDGNFMFTCKLEANETVRLEVGTKEDEAWPRIRAFKYKEYSDNAVLDADHPYHETVGAGGYEVWTKLTAGEEGLYYFGCDEGSVEDVWIDMCVYNESKNAVKSWGGETIWLDKNETVWIRTDCYTYDEELAWEILSTESYDIIVEADEIKSNDEIWSLTADQKFSFNVMSGYEENITLVDNGGTYQFSLYNSTQKSDFTFELYINEELVESGSVSSSGSSFEYTFDPAEIYSAVLKVYSKNYNYFNGYITATFVSPLQNYELTLGEPSEEVTVSDGSEAWFTYTVPKAGVYTFYSESAQTINSSDMATWARMEVKHNDGTGYTKTYTNSNSNNNYQFTAPYYFERGDKVTLKTYCQNHYSSEISYAVTVKEGPAQNVKSGKTLKKSSSIQTISISYSISDYYEAVIPLSFNDNGTYKFYMDPKATGYENLVMELYVNGERKASSSESSDSSVEYTYTGGGISSEEEAPSVELRLHNGEKYGYIYISSSIYVAYAYPHNETKLTLGSDAVTRTIQAGGEAWFTYKADTTGFYQFTITPGSENNSTYYYAELYVRTQQDEPYQPVTFNNQEFTINCYLNAGDEATLQIYADSKHNNTEEKDCSVKIAATEKNTVTEQSGWTPEGIGASTLQTTTYRTIESGSEVVMPVHLTAGYTYNFYPSDDKDVLIELYTIDAENNRHLAGEGSSVGYKCGETAETVELKIRKKNYQYYAGTLYLTYVQNSNMLKLDADPVQVESEASLTYVYTTFGFEAKKDGWYSFYASNASGINTGSSYTEIYEFLINNESRNSSGNISGIYQPVAGEDEMFRRNFYLESGDKVAMQVCIYKNDTKASYQMAVKEAETPVNTYNWALDSYTYIHTQPIEVYDHYKAEVEITLDLKNAVDGGTYKFSNNAGLTMELYVDGLLRASGDKEIEFPYSAKVESAKLRVYSKDGQRFPNTDISSMLTYGEPDYPESKN